MMRREFVESEASDNGQQHGEVQPDQNPEQELKQMRLSKSWQVERKHTAFYTGGKVSMDASEALMACACNDELKVVDLETGQVTNTFEGDTEPILAVAMRPNGTAVISASRSLQVKHWDIESESCVRSWKAHDAPVVDMAFDGTGTLLATGGTDRLARVWDLDKGYCTHNFTGHEGIVTVVAFHPDPHRLQLISASDDGVVRVWDLVTRNCSGVLSNHMSMITGLAFSPNGWTMVSAGRDKVLNVWDLHDFTLKSTIPVFETVEGVTLKEVTGDVASKKHLLAYTGGQSGALKVFDTATGKLFEEMKSSSSQHASIMHVTRGPSTGRIVCATAEQNIVFYDAADAVTGGKTLSSISLQLVGYNDDILDVRYISEDGSRIAVATNTDSIRLFDTESFGCQMLEGHTDTVLSLATSADMKLLASGSKDNTARVWDVETQQCAMVCSGHTDSIAAVAFSRKPKNPNPFLITGSSDKTIKLWPLRNLKKGGVKAAQTVMAHDKDINMIAVAPNDKIFASASQDKSVKVWSTADLSLEGSCRGHKRGVWCVEFSPIDRCMVTSSADTTIKIWALTDFSCIKTFQGHSNSVLRVSFINYGTQLISSSSDTLVKLWTIKTNECENSFDAHEDKIWALATSPDGSRVVTAGADSTINIWRDCTAEEELEREKEEEQFLLSEQELANCVRAKQYKKAMKLAFTLNKPFKMLELCKVMANDGDSIAEVIKDFSKDEIVSLLTYIQTWNTNGKHAHVAQLVLSKVFMQFPPHELMECSGIQKIIESLIPYSERHFTRMSKLVQQSHFIDFTLQSIRIAPQEMGDVAMTDGHMNGGADGGEDEGTGADEQQQQQQPRKKTRRK